MLNNYHNPQIETMVYTYAKVMYLLLPCKFQYKKSKICVFLHKFWRNTVNFYKII